MQQNAFRGFLSGSPVVKNLILINAVLLLATWVFGQTLGLDLVVKLGLYYPESSLFRPYQIVTHMFMHGGVGHLFFNMFALYMFGRVLESVWGSRRLLFYYLFTGLGAAALHLLVLHGEFLYLQSAVSNLLQDFNPGNFSAFLHSHFSEYYASVAQQGLSDWTASPGSPVLAERNRQLLQELITLRLNIPTVGASGAVYGLLLAFGVMFPNSTIYLLIPPIPLRAKWFVMLYAAIELYLGLSQPGSSVAHFAHLGGMLFGLILIRYWKRYGSRL